MNEDPSITKAPEILKKNHLAGGIKPIFACVGNTTNDFSNPERAFIETTLGRGSGAQNVDFYARSANLKKGEFLTAGRGTYVISPIDGQNKFSEGYADCTGLVVAGKERKTGDNISFLSHQDPTRVLYKKRETFIRHLQRRLAELSARCLPGTIDAIIIGGKYLTGAMNEMIPEFSQNYVNSIKLLGEEVEKILGFEPVVVNGPKTNRSMKGRDHIYFDSQHRRLYFLRPEVDQNATDFPSNAVEDKKVDYEKE